MEIETASQGGASILRAPGRLDSGTSEFEVAPDYAPAYHSLVVAAAETGRIEEAREALREVFRLQPAWKPRNHTGVWFFRHERDAERFLAASRTAAASARRLGSPALPPRAAAAGRSRGWRNAVTNCSRTPFTWLCRVVLMSHWLQIA